MSDEPLPVLCLPHAGAGASLFWGWTKLAVAGVSVVPVQLPGREERLAEQPYLDAHQAADGLLPEVLGLVGKTGPVALFGHSLGAVLAYELTRRLVSQSDVEVAHLFVSGSPGPAARRESRATGLPDTQFLTRVEQFAGTRHPIFDRPDMRELLLPILRADVALHEDYRPTAAEPLDVPITAIRGADDQLVSAGQTREWRELTSRSFHQAELPGGHMFLLEHPRELLDLIVGALAPRPAETP